MDFFAFASQNARSEFRGATTMQIVKNPGSRVQRLMKMSASKGFRKSAEFIYRLSSTGKSSGVYGPCEVCNKPVSEVFIQAEMRTYEDGLTYHACRGTMFGHEDCLKSLQRVAS